MNPANDNSELEEANVAAAKAIMQEPGDPPTEQLDLNPPLSAVLPVIHSPFNSVITINNDA